MDNEQQLPQQVSQQLTYIGPLPPSNEFAHYESVLPGSADRILKMAEQEAEYRHRIDEKTVKLLGRGQIFGLASVILSIGAIALCAVYKQPLAAIAPTIVAVTGLVSTFTSRK